MTDESEPEFYVLLLLSAQQADQDRELGLNSLASQIHTAIHSGRMRLAGLLEPGPIPGVDTIH